MTAARITPLRYTPGTRYSNSITYDEATDEVVHGWQVFVQRREDGTSTGRRSFVNNDGVLCGIEIAEAERERATKAAADSMLDALLAAAAFVELYTGDGVREQPPKWAADFDAVEIAAHCRGVIEVARGVKS